MLREGRLDLARTDFFAAAVDDVFDAPYEGEIPVFVQASQVTGAEPAVDEGGGICCRIVEVAVEYRRPARHDLAVTTLADNVVPLVDDGDLVVLRFPYGSGLTDTRRQRITRE